MKKFILTMLTSLFIGQAFAVMTLAPTTIPGSPFYCQHNFSMTFIASGGTAPYTYTTMSGTKPLGTGLAASTGKFGGVFGDTVATSYTFRIRATDANGDTVSRSYTMSILVHKLSINGLTAMWATQAAPTRPNLFDTWVSVANLVNNNGATGNDTTYFKNNGNSFLTSSVRLGTNNSRTLAFETVDTVRATFLTNGFLGVGTASPTARLHVVGRNNSASNYALKVAGASVTDALTVSNNGDLNLSNGLINTNYASGLVGIGSAPVAGRKLYVKSSDASGNFLYVEGANSNSQAILGALSDEPFLYMTSTALATNTVFISASGSSFINNGGSFGFNDGTPTAQVNIGAGSATAGTAPLKFTFGTLNTIPEDGAVEASGNDLYFADGIGRFKLGKVITGSDTMNVPIVAGTGAIYEKTITVTGAADGDVVSLGTTNAMATSGGLFFARVSGTDTVTVTFMNVVGGNLNPASGTVKLTVFKN